MHAAAECAITEDNYEQVLLDQGVAIGEAALLGDDLASWIGEVYLKCRANPHDMCARFVMAELLKRWQARGSCHPA
jgi:hypothetical protein